MDYCSAKTFPHVNGTLLGGGTNFLRIFNDLLAEVDQHYPIPDMRLDLSPHQNDCRENGMNYPTGPKGMLQGKFFRTVDVVLPMLCALLDHAIGDQATAPSHAFICHTRNYSVSAWSHAVLPRNPKI